MSMACVGLATTRLRRWLAWEEHNMKVGQNSGTTRTNLWTWCQWPHLASIITHHT